MRSNDGLPCARVASDGLNTAVLVIVLSIVLWASWWLAQRQPEVDRAAAAEAAQTTTATRVLLTQQGDDLGKLREVYARSWTLARWTREVHRLNPWLGQTVPQGMRLTVPSDGRLEAIEKGDRRG